MKRVMFMLFLMVAGCSWYVTPENWKKCENICKENKGIKFYQADLVDQCICNNNMSVSIKSIEE
jgi:hypothetical protein